MNAYLNQYQSTQVSTASPERILIMLYDGAIRFVRRGIEAIEAGDRQEKAVTIGKSMAIVSEFRNTLDHEIGGEVAANLDALYDFMVRELVRANVKDDAEPLRAVEGLLSQLRETWLEAVAQAQREQKAQAGKGTSEAATPRPLAATL